jgi:hypothetical protein
MARREHPLEIATEVQMDWFTLLPGGPAVQLVELAGALMAVVAGVVLLVRAEELEVSQTRRPREPRPRR